MVSTPGVLLDSEVPMSKDTFQLERNFRVQNVDSLKKHHKLTDYKVIHQYVISKHPFKLKRICGHGDFAVKKYTRGAYHLKENFRNST